MQQTNLFNEKEVTLAITDKFKKYKELRNKRRELKKQAKEIKSDMDEIEEEIKDWMIENDTTKMTVDNYTFYISETLWASAKKSAPDEEWQKLQNDPQFKDLIQNDVNTHSLSGRLREIEENLDVSESIEEWLEKRGLDKIISAYRKQKVNMRKS